MREGARRQRAKQLLSDVTSSEEKTAVKRLREEERAAVKRLQKGQSNKACLHRANKY